MCKTVLKVKLRTKNNNRSNGLILPVGERNFLECLVNAAFVKFKINWKNQIDCIYLPEIKLNMSIKQEF